MIDKDDLRAGVAAGIVTEAQAAALSALAHSRAGARDAMLVADADALDFSRIENASIIGLSAGASAPEILVEGVIDAISKRYDTQIETVETVREDITFNLPAALRD